MSESNDFINAAGDGDLNTVQSLVDKVNVNGKNESGHTALYKAADNGHLDVVKFLVAQDVDVNLADVRTQDGHHLMMMCLFSSLTLETSHSCLPILSLSFTTFTPLVALYVTSIFVLPNLLCFPLVVVAFLVDAITP